MRGSLFQFNVPDYAAMQKQTPAINYITKVSYICNNTAYPTYTLTSPKSNAMKPHDHNLRHIIIPAVIALPAMILAQNHTPTASTSDVTFYNNLPANNCIVPYAPVENAEILPSQLDSLLWSTEGYRIYQYDNGDDYPSDGLLRIIDKDNHIGYASENGEVVI